MNLCGSRAKWAYTSDAPSLPKVGRSVFAAGKIAGAAPAGIPNSQSTVN